DIVVTGRTTDAALTLGPLVHELGWASNDWDRLAAGTVAGHVLECGAQATGGNLTDWQRTAPLDVGYPVAEVAADGGFVVTKPAGSGGRGARAPVAGGALFGNAHPAAFLPPGRGGGCLHLRLRAAGAARAPGGAATRTGRRSSASRTRCSASRSRDRPGSACSAAGPRCRRPTPTGRRWCRATSSARASRSCVATRASSTSCRQHRPTVRRQSAE